MTSKTNRPRVQTLRCLLSVAVGILCAQSLAFRNVDSAAFDNFANLTAKGLDSIAQFGPAGSIALAVCLGVLFYRFYPDFKHAGKRDQLISVILSFFLALSIVVPRLMKLPDKPFDSYPNYVGGVPQWHKPIFWMVASIQLLTIGFTLAVILCWLMRKAAGFVECRNTGGVSTAIHPTNLSIWEKGVRFFDGKPMHMTVATLAMVLCWLPMLVIQGPAIIGVDSMVQLVQFRTGHVWDPMTMAELPGYVGQDHHPFFDTYLYGLFDELGLWLGQEILGFRILVILQSIVAAFAIVVSLVWIRKRTNLPDSCICACWGLAAILPAFPMYMSIVLKDSTWVSIFLLWMVAFFEVIYRCNNNHAIGWKLVLCLVVLGLFSGLTKKLGIYVTTVSLLLAIIVIRKQFAAFLISMLVPAALVIGFVPMVVLPALDIAPGGPQEAISVPIQQLSKVAIFHQDELSKSDRQAIDRVLDIDHLKPYWQADSADYAKHYGYRPDASSSDRKNFILTWIRLFFRYPKDYIAAVPYLISPFVYGETYYYSGPVRCGWWEAGGSRILTEYPECGLSYTQEKIAVPLTSALNKIPPFSFVGSEALYTVWLPLTALGLTLSIRRYKNLCYLIPTVVSWCSLFLLPAHQARYTLSFLFVFALTIAVPFAEVLTNKRNISNYDQLKNTQLALP